MVLPEVINSVLNEEGGVEVPHDTVIDELRKMASLYGDENGELSMAMAVYMLGFSIFTWVNFGWRQGLIFLIATLIMIFQFRKDIVDFFTGHGKRVDVLVTIKKKLGIYK